MNGSPYAKTSELAKRYKVTSPTIRQWVDREKQRREGFPRTKFKSDELNFAWQDILDWENSKQFD